MKLGSLFDGSGGFPLAGSLCGIDPVWASEVEPYPIAVTTSRFPKMKHLGDVSKVNGAEIEPVDVLTFGSPCQDLSVAGKRAGLKHEDNGDEETTRSGLFMESIRIIKEMREATNGLYPTFAVWENVPGAFSSNKGEDFKTVLEEFVKINEPTAEMPQMPKGGWAYADVIVGDGWSIAYRTFDLQYWGVPQRRRRIYLVADFRGERAHKVLFEREGVRGYFTEGRTPWQAAPADAQDRTGADDREGERAGDGRGLDAVKPYTLKMRSGCEGGGKGALVQEDKSATLATNNDQYLFQPVEPTGIIDNVGGQAEYAKVTHVNGTLRAGSQGLIAYAVENHPADSRVNIDENGKVQTLTSRMGTGGGNVPMVMEEKLVICLQGNGIDRADTAGCNGKGWNDKTCYTLNTIDRPAVAYGVETFHCNTVEDGVPTLKARDWKDPNVVAYGLDRASFNQGQNALFDFSILEQQQPTLTARGPGAVCHEVEPQYIVRRLTPTECARLQGFADKWGHIDRKEDFTEEEYKFWCDVYLTKQIIDGKVIYNDEGAFVFASSRKPYKDKTKAQMLTWYNKLHTDSSEYKMWGNGIGLPNALYVMQGIAEQLQKQKENT